MPFFLLSQDLCTCYFLSLEHTSCLHHVNPSSSIRLPWKPFLTPHTRPSSSAIHSLWELVSKDGPQRLTPCSIHAFCSPLPLNLLWPCDSFFWLVGCGRSNTVQFPRLGHKERCVFHLGLWEYPGGRRDTTPSQNPAALLWEAQATWGGYTQVLLSKAQLMPSWKPASADSHVKKPSWMSSPVESSHESSCHLPTTVWKTPSQNYLAEPSQSAEAWEAKVSICVKPSGWGVACHIAGDNWNRLRALYSLQHMSPLFHRSHHSCGCGFLAWLFN